MSCQREAMMMLRGTCLMAGSTESILMPRPYGGESLSVTDADGVVNGADVIRELAAFFTNFSRLSHGSA
jgi:hypothetical protein